MPAQYENDIPYLVKEAYTPDKDKKDKKKFYSVYYYSFDSFQKLLKKVFPNMNRWRRRFTRAYTDGRNIYSLDKNNWYSKIKHNRLLLHEVGHIEDLGDHRWLVPDLMHPSFLFRWSDKVYGKNN